MKIYVTMMASLYALSWNIYAAAPTVNCGGLPWCSDGADSADSVYGVIGNIISLMIQYITVLAVLAVMLWGIMYLLSLWDEEKAKKAKNIIIWSLVWVFLSVSAWSIIGIVNNFNIS